MASCPLSIMTWHYTVIKRTPTRQRTIKHRPDSPGNYGIKLRRPLSQHLSFYDAVKDLLTLLEGERTGPWKVSHYHPKGSLLPPPHFL